MNQERLQSVRPIHLSFRSVEQVLVEPEDQDRFMITAKEAARACKQADNDKEWQEKFETFLIFLQHWARDHADEIEAVFVDIGDGSLTILVSTPGEDYNFNLDDALSDLDLQLVHHYPWCIAEVMQVPSKIKEGQISFEKAIVVYGDGKRAQATSPA